MRIPLALSRTVELPCGYEDAAGVMHTAVLIQPLTMLEALRVDGVKASIPEDLVGLVDAEVWAILVRASAMSAIGTFGKGAISPRELLDLEEHDLLFLSGQCKEVSLRAASFRGGRAPDEGGDLPAGDADGVA